MIKLKITMKTLLNILLMAIIAVLGWQFLNLYKQYTYLEKFSEKLSLETAALKAENQNLESDIRYFSNPENMEKELKSKTNYKKPDEKMIIIIPSKDEPAER